MTVTVVADWTDRLRTMIEGIPGVAEESIVLAMNTVSQRKGMTHIKRTMRSQINFPKGYLEGGRLKVYKKASRGSPSVIIRGRDRPTSLARFALPGQLPSPRGRKSMPVSVKVDGEGSVRRLEGAFLMRLKNGNIGLAIRLPKGEEPRNTENAQQIGNSGVWLLYGPSVNQVFRDVAEDVKPPLADMIETEFRRQFLRLLPRV